MKRWAILLIVLVAVASPAYYYRAQIQHSRTAKDRVGRLLRDKSTTLSKSMANRVGDYESVKIEGVYPHIIWRRAIVDGTLTAGQNRYQFRVIDQDGNLKIEALVKL